MAAHEAGERRATCPQHSTSRRAAPTLSLPCDRDPAARDSIVTEWVAMVGAVPACPPAASGGERGRRRGARPCPPAPDEHGTRGTAPRATRRAGARAGGACARPDPAPGRDARRLCAPHGALNTDGRDLLPLDLRHPHRGCHGRVGGADGHVAPDLSGMPDPRRVVTGGGRVCGTPGLDDRHRGPSRTARHRVFRLTGGHRVYPDEQDPRRPVLRGSL